MYVKQAYGYDDVLLEPKVTDIDSRSEVNVEDSKGVFPIFASPMPKITGYELVRACADANIYGILHRFDSFDNRIRAIDYLSALQYNKFGVAVGVTCKEEFRVAQYAWEHGAELICVDVAHGGLKKVADFVEVLRNHGIENVMAGNVATREMANVLSEAGARYIRVGIGGGSLCTTRNITGIGVPDLTAIEDVNLSKYRNDFYLVADGGIRNSGNAVKAFAVGADYVMLGSYLAQANEAEHNDGKIYGAASRNLQESMSKEIKSVEGMEKTGIKKIAPLTELIIEFIMGIKSACTYLNCRDYREIKNNATFISVGKGDLKQL